MARKRPKPTSATDPPADDACAPALLTPRRLAGELERIGLEVSRQEHRLKRLGAYADSQSFPALAEALGDVADGLAELGGRVLVGEVGIVAGRDEAAGRDRYPLLERAPAAGPVPPAPAPEPVPSAKNGRPAKAERNGKADHRVKPAEAPGTAQDALYDWEVPEGGWPALDAGAGAPGPAAGSAIAESDHTSQDEARLADSRFDSKHDVEKRAAIADWRRRQLAGDTEPRWGQWCEFTVQLADGKPVHVVHDPTWGKRSETNYGGMHLEYHGPLTETGYRSHFVGYGADGERAATMSLRDYAEAAAREVDEPKKAARKRKAEKEPKPAKGAGRKPRPAPIPPGSPAARAIHALHTNDAAALNAAMTGDDQVVPEAPIIDDVDQLLELESDADAEEGRLAESAPEPKIDLWQVPLARLGLRLATRLVLEKKGRIATAGKLAEFLRNPRRKPIQGLTADMQDQARDALRSFVLESRPPDRPAATPAKRSGKKGTGKAKRTAEATA